MRLLTPESCKTADSMEAQYTSTDMQSQTGRWYLKGNIIAFLLSCNDVSPCMCQTSYGTIVHYLWGTHSCLGLWCCMPRHSAPCLISQNLQLCVNSTVWLQQVTQDLSDGHQPFCKPWPGAGQACLTASCPSWPCGLAGCAPPARPCRHDPRAPFCLS